MRRSALFWGSAILVLGVLLLLNNLGVFSINIWGIILPAFMVFLGVWILISTRAVRNIQIERIEIPLEGSSQAKIRLQHGAGRIKVGAGVDSVNLVQGECSGGVNTSVLRHGNTIDVTISVPDQIIPFNWGPGYSLDWDLQLSSGIPLDLVIQAGAGEAKFDLSSLLVKDLKLNSGASSTWMKFPTSAGQTRAVFTTGAASLNLVVPDGVAARIRTSAGLANITVDTNRFPRSGGFYQSRDYDTAPNKVDIEIKTGVGSADIR